jgi:hypothetical protein
MNFFILIMLMINTCYATDLNTFLSELNIRHQTLGHLELSKNVKVPSLGGIHYLFILNDSEKGIYDIDFQTAVEPDASKMMMRNLSNLFFMSYSDKASPYAGEITNVAKCPKAFYPKLVKVVNGKRVYHYYTSSAGSRFQFGVCEKEYAVYSACSLFYYFEEKKILAKIKYFKPFEKNQDCKNGMNKLLTGLII